MGGGRRIYSKEEIQSFQVENGVGDGEGAGVGLGGDGRRIL